MSIMFQFLAKSFYFINKGVIPKLLFPQPKCVQVSNQVIVREREEEKKQRKSKRKETLGYIWVCQHLASFEELKISYILICLDKHKISPSWTGGRQQNFTWENQVFKWIILRLHRKFAVKRRRKSRILSFYVSFR